MAERVANLRQDQADFGGKGFLGRLAQVRVKRRQQGPLEPRWGRSTCLTFTGRTYELLGEPTRAADYFRRALAQHPADHEAKAGLARVTEAK